MRLNAQTSLFENGSVLLPRNAPWLADYIAELTGFPGSRHADQVDSTTQALDYLRTKYTSLLDVDWNELEQNLKKYRWSKGRDWRTR
jgi:phage terminase large subunit-like protein